MAGDVASTRVECSIDPRALERISVSISASGRVRVSVVTQSRANPVLGLTADEAEL